MSNFKLGLVALAVGTALAVAAVFIAGFIAAVPIPGIATQFRHDHASLISLTLDLLGALPVVLLAWVVGHVIARATRKASLLLLVGTPWVLLGLYDRVWYLRNCGATLRTAVSILLSGHYLEAWSVSLLSIPVGLWLASMTFAARKARDNQPPRRRWED